MGRVWDPDGCPYNVLRNFGREGWEKYGLWVVGCGFWEGWRSAVSGQRSAVSEKGYGLWVLVWSGMDRIQGSTG